MVEVFVNYIPSMTRGSCDEKSSNFYSTQKYYTLKRLY